MQGNFISLNFISVYVYIYMCVCVSKITNIDAEVCAWNVHMWMTTESRSF